MKNNIHDPLPPAKPPSPLLSPYDLKNGIGYEENNENIPLKPTILGYRFATSSNKNFTFTYFACGRNDHFNACPYKTLKLEGPKCKGGSKCTRNIVYSS